MTAAFENSSMSDAAPWSTARPNPGGPAKGAPTNSGRVGTDETDLDDEALRGCGSDFTRTASFASVPRVADNGVSARASSI